MRYMTYDLSKGTVETHMGQTLSRSRVQQVLDEVYSEFASDTPLQQHLVEFSALFHTGNDCANPQPDLSQLKRFDYLQEPRLDIDALRTKGSIALSMIVPEIFEGEISAFLAEPFKDTIVLPQLYRRWKAHRNGWATTQLDL
jgi:hypothetical protein